LVPPMPSTAVESGLSESEPQREAKRNRISRLLLNTILDTIEAETAPLSDFLRHLGEEFKRQNPEGPAINFVLSKKSRSLEVIPESVLAEATITIKPALHRVRMQDVVSMIPTVSSIPLTASIEPYGVLFAPGMPRENSVKSASLGRFGGPSDRVQNPMTAKAFQLSPHFLKGLQETFGLNIPDVTLTADAEKKIKSALSSLAERLGITPLDPDKQIFFNQNGVALMIRAPDRDLAVLEAAILTAGGISLGNKSTVAMDRMDLSVPEPSGKR